MKRSRQDRNRKLMPPEVFVQQSCDDDRLKRTAKSSDGMLLTIGRMLAAVGKNIEGQLIYRNGWIACS